MTGIILAAGLGSRLKEKTIDLPKALLQVNHKPLIDYALDFISGEVDKLIIIGGYCFNQLKIHLEKKKLNHLTLIENPDYKKGSILTIEKALDHLNDSFILMNVDHIYPKHFVKKILSNLNSISGMCDFDRELIADDMKVKLNDKRQIIKIDKKLTDFDGGYIGMTSCHIDLVPKYKECVRQAIAELGDKVNVESVLQLFANHQALPNIVDLSGSTWLEIDDGSDLAKAEQTLKTNPNLK